MDIKRNMNNRPLTYVGSDHEQQQVLTPNVIPLGQNAHTIEPEGDDNETNRMQKRLAVARQHAWSRWQKEYVHGLMELHKINKGGGEVPQLGEIVLIVGEERNCGKRMKGRILRYVNGKDGVIRGAIILHKGNYIERPIQLLCPLEIRSPLNFVLPTLLIVVNCCRSERACREQARKQIPAYMYVGENLDFAFTLALTTRWLSAPHVPYRPIYTVTNCIIKQ